jgi:hypothetical protein
MSSEGLPFNVTFLFLPGVLAVDGSLSDERFSSHRRATI